jgi:hypothetical protein
MIFILITLVDIFCLLLPTFIIYEYVAGVGKKLE